MANYKHRVVEGLAQLVDKYGGGGKDPMMRAVWFGIKGQVPSILQNLDDNEEAIALIESKLVETLNIEDAKGLKEELVSLFKRRNKDRSVSIRIPADSKLGALFPLDTAKFEAVIEVAEE